MQFSVEIGGFPFFPHRHTLPIKQCYLEHLLEMAYWVLLKADGIPLGVKNSSNKARCKDNVICHALHFTGFCQHRQSAFQTQGPMLNLL